MMKKALIPAAIVALVLSPAAQAETSQTITVDITYDKAMLADEATAKEVLASIKDQAKSACFVRRSISSSAYTDYACVDNVSAQAIDQIIEQQAAEGLKTSDAFVNLAAFEIADAGQR